MARRKSELALEAKLEEAKRLEAEIKRLRNAARDRLRAEDEQRQKIVGRMVLAAINDQPEGELAHAIKALLAKNLKRTGERALFPELSGNGAAVDTVHHADVGEAS